MTRLTRPLAALAVLVALAAPAAAQGVLAPYAKLQFFDNNGDPLTGGLLYTYASGTTTPQSTYSDAALSTPNANPVVLDSAGRATVYLSGALNYKFILRNSLGVEVWTQDTINGPFSGVFTVTAADTRGFRISRAGADAGMSIASTGGSGKTYGLVSNTSGVFAIRDDADGTPRIELSGEDVIVTTSTTGPPSFRVVNGLLNVSGGGNHSMSASYATGGNVLSMRNTSSNANAFSGFNIGNDSSATAAGLWALSSNWVTSGIYQQNSTHIGSSLSGGLTLGSTHATADIRIATADTVRAKVLASGRLSWEGGYASGGLTLPAGFQLGAQASTERGQLIFGDGTGYSFSIGHSASGAYTKDLVIDDRGYVQAPRTPGFMVYNTALDSVATGGTLDFDTEAYDTMSNFASDTFTAPVAGFYHFCANVQYSDNSASELAFSFNIAGVLYQFFWNLATSSGSASGCVLVNMSTSQTATVQVTTADVDVDIEGSASPRITTFSGRLVP